MAQSFSRTQLLEIAIKHIGVEPATAEDMPLDALADLVGSMARNTRRRQTFSSCAEQAALLRDLPMPEFKAKLDALPVDALNNQLAWASENDDRVLFERLWANCERLPTQSV